MEVRYKVYYSEHFVRKIQNISNYIKYELQNPIASYRFQIKVKQTISILYYFPQVGPKYNQTQYRYLTIKHWIILYEIQDKMIEVAKIFSSKQNPEKFNLF